MKTDDLITRFFRLCTEMCVELTYGTLKAYANNPSMVRAKCFQTLDAYTKLIILLVKLSGDANNTLTKINLLNKVCLLNAIMSSSYLVMELSSLIIMHITDLHDSPPNSLYLYYFDSVQELMDIF